MIKWNWRCQVCGEHWIGPDSPFRCKCTERLVMSTRKGARMRPTWESYAMSLAKTASNQSQDPYVQVGACVLRQDHTVAGLGFNGPPSKVEIDWSDRDARRPLVIHAEQNALRYCQPQDVAGGLVAVTHRPCVSCTAIIASYKIRQVVYLHENDASTYDESELRRVAEAFQMEVTRL